VDDPGKDGNASMPEQVKRPNPWKKKMMMMIIIIFPKRCSRLRTAGPSAIFDYFRRSVAIFCLLFDLIIFQSPSNSFLHLLRGLAIFIVPSTVAAAICCGIPRLCILST
jgi:hypothetical protein